MTIETITDQDQPDFEPGDPTRRAQPDGGLISRSTQAEQILADAESPLIAFLQSALLTGISASLVSCGSAAPAQIRPLSHSRARTAVRHAAQPAEKLEHLGSFHQMWHPWALSSPASESVDPVKCGEGLDEAM